MQQQPGGAGGGGLPPNGVVGPPGGVGGGRRPIIPSVADRYMLGRICENLRHVQQQQNQQQQNYQQSNQQQQNYQQQSNQQQQQQALPPPLPLRPPPPYPPSSWERSDATLPDPPMYRPSPTTIDQSNSLASSHGYRTNLASSGERSSNYNRSAAAAILPPQQTLPSDRSDYNAQAMIKIRSSLANLSEQCQQGQQQQQQQLGLLLQQQFGATQQQQQGGRVAALQGGGGFRRRRSGGEELGGQGVGLTNGFGPIGLEDGDTEVEERALRDALVNAQLSEESVRQALAAVCNNDVERIAALLDLLATRQANGAARVNSAGSQTAPHDVYRRPSVDDQYRTPRPSSGRPASPGPPWAPPTPSWTNQLPSRATANSATVSLANPNADRYGSNAALNYYAHSDFYMPPQQLNAAGGVGRGFGNSGGRQGPQGAVGSTAGGLRSTPPTSEQQQQAARYIMTQLGGGIHPPNYPDRAAYPSAARNSPLDIASPSIGDNGGLVGLTTIRFGGPQSRVINQIQDWYDPTGIDAMDLSRMRSSQLGPSQTGLQQAGLNTGVLSQSRFNEHGLGEARLSQAGLNLVGFGRSHVGYDNNTGSTSSQSEYGGGLSDSSSLGGQGGVLGCQGGVLGGQGARYALVPGYQRATSTEVRRPVPQRATQPLPLPSGTPPRQEAPLYIDHPAFRADSTAGRAFRDFGGEDFDATAFEKRREVFLRGEQAAGGVPAPPRQRPVSARDLRGAFEGASVPPRSDLDPVMAARLFAASAGVTAAESPTVTPAPAYHNHPFASPRAVAPPSILLPAPQAGLHGWGAQSSSGAGSSPSVQSESSFSDLSDRPPPPYPGRRPGGELGVAAGSPAWPKASPPPQYATPPLYSSVGRFRNAEERRQSAPNPPLGFFRSGNDDGGETADGRRCGISEWGSNSDHVGGISHGEQQRGTVYETDLVETDDEIPVYDTVVNPPRGGAVVGGTPDILESPKPVRRRRTNDGEATGGKGGETLFKHFSPAAYRFYMEQHVENLLKSYQQRQNRRYQLEKELSQLNLPPTMEEQLRAMLYQKESNYLRLKRAKLDRAQFERIKTLGSGAFGKVELVRKRDTNALYALKVLNKVDVLKRHQVAHVKAERDILAEADNEWVVRLHYSFQDEEKLYIVMDYIPGGDMMGLLIRLAIFSESLARFYIAELVLAIESVHALGFIHRDIKPDNILIDRDGHIKLTDFGLCTGFRWTHDSKYYQRGDHSRHNSMDPGLFDEDDDVGDDESSEAGGSQGGEEPSEGGRGLPGGARRGRGGGGRTVLEKNKQRGQRCLAHSLVGTPNYIAPEVLSRSGYTRCCDWWSVGVILYEMRVGQPPFHADSPVETQAKVLGWAHTLHIPSQAQLLPPTAEFILRLLCSAEDRLGARGGAAELRSHPYFSGVAFESLRQHPAPYLPQLRHATDTSNFDPVDDGTANDRNLSGDSFARPGGGEAPGGEVGRTGGGAGGVRGVGGEFDSGNHAFLEFTFRRFFSDDGRAYATPMYDPETNGPIYV